MADQLLEQVRDAVEGQIDFKGQQLAEFLATGLLATVGVSSFILYPFVQTLNSGTGYCVYRRLLPSRYKALSRHWTRWNRSYLPARRTSMAILQSTPCQMVTSNREGRAISGYHRGWEASWMKSDEVYLRIIGVRDMGIPQNIAFEEGNHA
jgi:hypothetical protein